MAFVSPDGRLRCSASQLAYVPYMFWLSPTFGKDLSLPFEIMCNTMMCNTMTTDSECLTILSARPNSCSSDVCLLSCQDFRVVSAELRTDEPSRHQKRVRFDLDNVSSHPVTAYSDVYGLHPSQFDFDGNYNMIPLECSRDVVKVSSWDAAWIVVSNLARLLF